MMKKTVLLALTLLASIWGYSQNLKTIEQNFQEAVDLAKEEDKLIFIDFYTTWCVPCKKLDKLVFKNDSIQQLLGKEFILLKYDAEKDKTYHLSKKHHVSSYPTAIILNQGGYVVNRKNGFPGEDFASMSKNVINFTEESLILNQENKVLKGYSNKIDISKYPKFYIDFVNRDNLKFKEAQEFKDYWLAGKDPLSEEYFSTLLYFGSDAPNAVADEALKRKDEYLELFGTLDTEVLFYYLTLGKFNSAILNRSEEEYKTATEYAKKALSQRWLDDILPSFELNWLKAQGKWNEVFAHYEGLLDKGDLSNGGINHFCWDVYQDCDDQAVIAKCIKWMDRVTSEEPDYNYLDTYAFLVYKSGNKQETKRVAQLALEAAKREGKKTQSIEKLMEKVDELK